MKLCIASLSVLLTATPSIAHDVWMQPQSYQVDPGQPIPVAFLIGHGPFRDRWSNNAGIELLVDRTSSGSRDIHGDLLSSGPLDMVTRFTKPGLHVLGMQSSYAYSELPSIRFNDYAKAEGLTPVLAARTAQKTMNDTGRERYSRRAKAIIRVGRATPTDQALATRPIGLKLEIVPERNPYALGPSRTLPVHVLYNGKALASATIMLTDLANDAKPLATAITDRAGRASFQVPAKGNFLLNVLWSEAVQGNPKFDFDTTFSSLTFGY